MEEPADPGNEYRFIGEEGGGVVRVDFNDVRVVMMETAMEIKRVDSIEDSVGEYVVSRGGHILWIQRESVHE